MADAKHVDSVAGSPWLGGVGDEVVTTEEDEAQAWYCEVCRPGGNGNPFAGRGRCVMHGGDEHQPTNASTTGFVFG